MKLRFLVGLGLGILYVSSFYLLTGNPHSSDHTITSSVFWGHLWLWFHISTSSFISCAGCNTFFFYTAEVVLIPFLLVARSC